MRYRAVIFDMDGVLLDSEPLHFEALNAVLAPEGFVLSESDNEHILGTTLEGTFRHVGSVFPLHYSAEEYYDRYDRTVLEMLRQPLDAAPGVTNLLNELSVTKVPLAVASSSRGTWVEATLNSLGIRDRFRAIVSGDQVTHGKPDPEIYLVAANLLDIPAAECVAIEDAPHGILSASRAGMKVLAVRTPYTDHLELVGADRVVDSLTEVTIAGLDRL